MPTRLAASVFFCVAACGASPPVARPASPASGPTSQPTARGKEPRALAGELRFSVLESYRSLSGGYEEAYLDGLAHDDNLMLLGLGPADVVVGFSPDASVLARVFAEGDFQLVSKALEVRLSRDATVGWIHDELSYRMVTRGLVVAIPLRLTAVYERRDDRWLLVAEHLSYGMPIEELLQRHREGRASWRPLAAAQATDATVAEVRAVLDGLLSDEDPAQGRARIDAAAYVVGVDPGQVWEGPTAADSATLRAQLGYDVAVRPVDVRIQLSRSRAVAWAVADVAVEGARDGRPVELAVRMSWVLERRDDGWKVVVEHAQVPLAREELASRIFGQDGEP